jgi:inhibitor of cysteine peptidase
MAKIGVPEGAWLLLAWLLLFPLAVMASDPAAVTVTRAQDGREIALKVGNILEIELPGIGGTGYLWVEQATGAPYLKLVDQTTRPDKQGRLGGPVIQVWRFKAEKPGTTEIKMAYYRPWEGVVKATDHFLVKLRIK